MLKNRRHIYANQAKNPFWRKLKRLKEKWSNLRAHSRATKSNQSEEITTTKTFYFSVNPIQITFKSSPVLSRGAFEVYL